MEAIPAAATTADRQQEYTRILIAAGLMLLTALFAYADSFRGPFILDDVLGILRNPTLRQLWPLSGPLTPIAGGLTVSGRPILNLSLAINHAISGVDVWSYHALNLLIHFLAALVLFGIVRRTLDRASHAAPLPLAALAATLWLAHPLQTESVTYMVQRAESLMGLLYLLTLYAVIRGAGAPRPGPWYAVAVLACTLGMATKEVMATAPLVILLYDRTFLAGSLAQAWRKRRAMYCLLASTWLLLLWLLLSTGNRDSSYGIGTGVPWWSHAAMQFEAVTHYLWLSLWPHPLIFDYGLMEPHGFLDVLPYALVVLALLTATVIGVVRNAPWGFLGAWFFLILAPTSSILPSARQTFSEHRMYLPLAAVSVVAALALYSLLQRRIRPTVLAGALWIAVLCLLTADRNQDYRSDLALYTNVVAISPRNAFGQFVLANALATRGREAEALEHFDIAARFKPDDKAIRINRAYTLLRLNRATEAVAEYEAGFRLGPVTPDAFLGYAAALVATGRGDEGMDYFSEYTRQRSQDPVASVTVAELLLAVGRPVEAIGYLERAQAIVPGDPGIAALMAKARQQ